MAPDPQLSVVVLGGGIGGLCAAAAALPHAGSVTLLDRDDLRGRRFDEESIEQSARRRPSVAQYTLPHALLVGGSQAMDALVPGFLEQAERNGVKKYDCGTGVGLFDHGGMFVRGHIGLEVHEFSRRSLNQLLQDMVLAQGGDRLTVREKTKVAGLLWSEDKAGVEGVVLASGEEVRADLVVVADGRKSQLRYWLEEVGVKLPPPLKVDGKANYSSMWMALPDDYDLEREWNAFGCRARGTCSGLAAHRMAYFFVNEGRFLQIGMFAAGGELAPVEMDTWLAFAKGMPDQTVYNMALRCKQITPLQRIAGFANWCPQYHKAKLPQGLVVLGDAAMSLNPVYGQGMTVAAVGALELQRCMAGALAGKAGPAAQRAAVRTFGRRFQARLHKRSAICWGMACSEDMQFPGVVVEGMKRPPKLLSAYFNALLAEAKHDLALFKAMFSVGQMVAPPSQLFAPRVASRVLGRMLRDATACGGGAKVAGGEEKAAVVAAQKGEKAEKINAGAGKAAPGGPVVQTAAVAVEAAA